jgi:ankyrin repeat protein
MAARFSQPGIMRVLRERGADPLFVHRSESVSGRGFQLRTDATNVLMAALGMGGGTPWVQPARAEREALTLEAVRLAVESGVDVNAAYVEGRTALAAAKRLNYESVVRFLTERGAR